MAAGDSENTGGLTWRNMISNYLDIGEGVVEGEVVTWHVSVGDSVSEEDPIVDVMTDKAATIPSPTQMMLFCPLMGR